jgi:undecaprenyl-diphosphatase
MNSLLFDSINELAGHVGLLDALMEDVAKYSVFLLVLVAGALWFVGDRSTRATHQRMVLAAVAAVALSLFLAQAVSHLYYHARPFVERGDVRLLIGHSSDSSVPSEHASVAFAAAGAVLWLRWRLGVALLGLALLVGVARIYVGVHYPADIAAGAAIGLTLSCVVSLAGRPIIGRAQAVAQRYLPPPLG